jgi:hypothetical protein
MVKVAHLGAGVKIGGGRYLTYVYKWIPSLIHTWQHVTCCLISYLLLNVNPRCFVRSCAPPYYHMPSDIHTPSGQAAPTVAEAAAQYVQTPRYLPHSCAWVSCAVSANAT